MRLFYGSIRCAVQRAIYFKEACPRIHATSGAEAVQHRLFAARCNAEDRATVLRSAYCCCAVKHAFEVDHTRDGIATVFSADGEGINRFYRASLG